MIHCASNTTPATTIRDHRVSLTNATVRTERSEIVTMGPTAPSGLILWEELWDRYAVWYRVGW